MQPFSKYVQHPVLYKRDTTGKIRTWQIEQDFEKYRMLSGAEHGVLVASTWTVATGKNEGRANETNSITQAEFEIEAAYTKKIKEGYRYDKKEVDNIDLIKPMLAKNYKDYEKKLKFPVIVQPKLDGIRCLITKSGMFSRKGEKIISCPHILSALAPVFQDNPDIIIDGELYNHEFMADFNTLASIIRKTKPEEVRKNLVESANKIQYHIYDVLDQNLSWFERVTPIITKLMVMGDSIKFLESHTAQNAEEIDKLYSTFVELGYEGVMVRDPVAGYEPKRSVALLKYKEFMEEEFTIVGVEEGVGNRSGMAGAINMLTKDNKPFKATPMGTDEHRRQLLKDAARVINAHGTVKFFHYTPDGIPRFPVFKAVRFDV